VSAEVVSADHEWHRANIELQRAVAVQEAAQVAREAQNGRYLAGLSSLLELLDAEDLEQKARQRRIEARRDEAVAVVRLLGACGLLGR
jgi:outer membrane protein TolC